MAYTKYPTKNDSTHLAPNYAIMDSGNNKRHSLNRIEYFPLGVRWHKATITGVHGPQTVEVGVGTAHFATKCVDNTTKYWCVPNSMYNPKSPVNLLCMNRFHYKDDGISPTKHEWRPKEQILYIDDGRTVRIAQDHKLQLPLAHIHPYKLPDGHTRDKYAYTKIDILQKQDLDSTLQCFTHTHLQPMTTDVARMTMNDPLERYFNTTIQHKMLKGLEDAKPIKSINRADRPDSWYQGRMTQRTVPANSRRPTSIKLTPGSHIVSDIGEVPVPDRSGNKYYVLFKDLCTQYRRTYRMKTKDELVGVWQIFLADSGYQHNKGAIVSRVKYLVTDDDKMYVAGKVKEVNTKRMIGKWTLAPYTHNANPSESEMRRIMEGAVSALYSSGLPPSFLLDALECNIHSKNRLFTPVHHDPKHEFMTPHERLFGIKPSIDDMARFGCKTYVYITKEDRKKHDTHCWIGFYLGLSDNMRACRVYRPHTHTVYDRYHTLHDCKIVYGDIMGPCITRE